jgi:hypothetical protein
MKNGVFRIMAFWVLGTLLVAGFIKCKKTKKSLTQTTKPRS